MKIAVRADATSEMGFGHLRRCLSLADALRELGAVTCFVIREDAVAKHIMAGRPYPVFWLPACDEGGVLGDMPHAALAKVRWQRDAQETAALLSSWTPDFVIVDHYAFDARWHEATRNALACLILAIDDLGDRPLAADMLLDGNAADSHVEKYAGRLKRTARILTGPRFALLSPSYLSAPRYTFSPDVRSVGIFMGGTDELNLSAKVIEMLRGEAGFTGGIEIVSSAANRHLEELARVCEADGNAILSVDLPELSAFYARHDIQIGAGGTSSYERCCIGAPTVAIVFAVNQLAVVPILSALGVVRGATVPGVEATKLLEAAPLGAVVQALIADPEARRVLSETSRHYVDGRGAARVALAVLADTVALRPATLEDATTLYRWRNDPATRSVSINRGEIAYEDHVRWLGGVLVSPGRILLIATIGIRPIGVIRFDALGGGAWEVSLYMDPDLHGLGLGKRMLLAGEARMRNADEPAVKVHAQVVAGNLVSLMMFESAGYQSDAGFLVKTLRKPNVA